MVLPRLHRAVDDLAMWREDRKPRAPAPFRGAEGVALDCFGPLPALPAPPPRRGPFHLPSPRPLGVDRLLVGVAATAHGPRRGTAVLVPPWKLPSLGWIGPWAEALARAGLDVWTLVPPRHLERTAPGAESGEGFVSPDVPTLRAVFEQLVLEVRLLSAVARGQGGRVAVVGLSLGGLAAALAATGPERVDAVAAVAPPADLAAVFAETRIGRRYLALAVRAGAPPPPAAALASQLAPFRAELRPCTARRALVAVAEHDRIALAPGARALARAWGAELRSFPRGHLTLLFACRAVRERVAAFAAG